MYRITFYSRDLARQNKIINYVVRNGCASWDERDGVGGMTWVELHGWNGWRGMEWLKWLPLNLGWEGLAQ